MTIDDPKKSHWSDNRGRGLARFERRFPLHLMAGAIDEARARGERPRVLEIGSGQGRLLLDLLRRFPDLELHGLNKKPWKQFSGASSLLSSAQALGLFTPEEFAPQGAFELPRLHFHDASELRFPSDHFDLVVSQVAFFYIEQKVAALQEVWRVLKPGGVALLQIDSGNSKLPPLMQHETPRFVVKDGETPIPLGRIFSGLAEDGFFVTFERSRPRIETSRIHYLLKMKKNRPDPLPIELEFDAKRSQALAPLRSRDEDGSRSWFHGHQSVYLATSATRLGPPEIPAARVIVPKPRSGRQIAAAAAIAAIACAGILWGFGVRSKQPLALRYLRASIAVSHGAFGGVASHDSDGDGITDYADRDVDGDGRSNSTEQGSPGDIDGDGVDNAVDPDIDGDLIPNDADGDVDGDGLVNGTDSDADGDGVINGSDDDIDGDEVANPDDADEDGDGRANKIDSDVDDDGIVNSSDADADADRLPNEVDPSALGSEADLPRSSDRDGDDIDNRVDLDVDGDGVPNATDDDVDGDDLLNASAEEDDIDGDRILDELDDDADGDGVENANDDDIDADGSPNSEETRWSDDLDGDGIKNWIDVDTDNDGVIDRIDSTPAGV